MPTKKKRSFLQRIMGAENNESRIDLDQTIMTDQETEVPVGGPGNQQYQVPQEQIQQDQQNTVPTMNQSVAPQQVEAKSTDNEEEGSWVADQEGQLTIDVFQTDTDIVIKSTIAGVKPEDLDIQINNDMVTIRGERRKEDEIRDEDYYYQECYWGSFSRSIILPVDVQANKAEAIMKNGILTLRLPKAETAKARKIQVRGY